MQSELQFLVSVSILMLLKNLRKIEHEELIEELQAKKKRKLPTGC